MKNFRTRITRLAVASAVAITLGGIGAGQAMAADAPVRGQAVEDGGGATIQGPCQYNPYYRCMD